MKSYRIVKVVKTEKPSKQRAMLRTGNRVCYYKSKRQTELLFGEIIDVDRASSTVKIRWDVEHGFSRPTEHSFNSDLVTQYLYEVEMS